MATGPVKLLNILRVPGVVEILLASRPAWLWDAAEGRILFANAAGTAFFRESHLSALRRRRFDSAQPGFAALVRAAATLPRDGTPRLALLRFYIGPRDVTVPCRCHLPDGGRWPNAVMVAAAAGARDSRPPEAQAAILFDDLDRPVVLHRDGEEVYRNVAADEAEAQIERSEFDLEWHGDRLRLCIGDDGDEAVDEPCLSGRRVRPVWFRAASAASCRSRRTVRAPNSRIHSRKRRRRSRRSR
jgi:hypothetical protein